MSRPDHSHSDSRHDGAIPHSSAMAIADSRSVHSPLRLVMIIVMIVFFAETFEMTIFSLLPSFPVMLEALADATLLVLLISPVLYFFVYRPFVQQVNNLDRAERALQKANLELEKKVGERTAELTAANATLRQEVADRKRAEQVLKDSVDRIRRIADNLPLLIAHVDADQRYQFASHEFENWFGISPSEFIGQKVKAMLGPEAYTVVRKQIETVLSGRPVTYEDKLPLPDGSTRHYHANYIPDFSSGNSAAGFYLVVQDITARKLAEQELKREVELNAVLSELYEPLISPSAKIADIALTVLEKAKGLTRSEHGYMSSIDPATGDIVSHTLTEMLEGQFKDSADRKITFPIGKDGRYSSLWGHALNTLEPFYTNSPSAYPASAGLPGGHIPLECFLSVPVMLGDELVGQIALANKKTDYTRRDLKAIERVAEFYALALQRNRVEEALQNAKKELERRVKERTAELQQTNDRLKAEIEDRIRFQEPLEFSKSMLQLVVDGISDPLVLLGGDLNVKLLNKAAAEYFGLSGYQDILDHKCHQVLRESAAPCESCEVPTAIFGGKSMVFERRGFKDTDRLEQVFLYPVEIVDGGDRDVLLRISDITEQRLLEKQIIQSEKMASLGTMVSSVAHEINNPINFISFNIPILRDYVNDLMPIVDDYAGKHPEFEICHLPYHDFREDICKLLDNIEHGSGRITTFVSNLKDFSQVQDKVRENWVDLDSVLDRVLSIFRAQFNKRVQPLIAHLPANSVRIWTDANALEQVLLNLLVNAAQATEKENSRVELNVEIRDSWLDNAIFEVRDNGSGMDGKTLQKIYDPFFTTRSGSGGTGLGLYVCHNLVQGLRGRIEVESQPGKGSAFRVILPGKELLSRAIHAASSRAGAVFTPVNMESLNASLFDAQFFGHSRGAFTGAEKDQVGYLESSNRGTLFLDEIGNLPHELQGKLLRVLQDGEFIKIGSSRPQNANIRFIAATNSDLDRLMARKLFRKDLYYRLRGGWLHLPPLRERRNDIPLLINSFLEEFCGSGGVDIEEEALSFLLDYEYPGNIRELKTIVQSAVNLCQGRPISTKWLPDDLRKRKPLSRSGRTSESDPVVPLGQVGKNHILSVYQQLGKNKSRTARALGIGLNTLRRKLESYG